MSASAWYYLRRCLSLDYHTVQMESNACKLPNLAARNRFHQARTTRPSTVRRQRAYCTPLFLGLQYILTVSARSNTYQASISRDAAHVKSNKNTVIRYVQRVPKAKSLHHGCGFTVTHRVCSFPGVLGSMGISVASPESQVHPASRSNAVRGVNSCILRPTSRMELYLIGAIPGCQDSEEDCYSNKTPN